MKRHLVLGITSLALAICPTSGNAQRAAATTLEGDVYLLMQNGDTKKGAGRTVYLLRTDKALETVLTLACTVAASELAAVNKQADQVVLQQARTKADESLANLMLRQRLLQDKKSKVLADFLRDSDDEIRRSVIDSVGSGVNAHYRFALPKGGRYIVTAKWMIGRTEYEWWVPVDVRTGQRASKDLDNAAEGDVIKARCGQKG